MDDPEALIENHDLSRTIQFRVKSSVLTALRHAKNTFLEPVEKFSTGNQLCEAEVVSISETDLWSTDDHEKNWILTAGKVQNLRVAVRRLNGIEVPAEAVFSFWRHVGTPATRRGYVTGREIREGCVVPTIAGGLCQLSNALYDAALKAGFEIVERHRHSRVIKGSLAEVDRDATVKWNYVDLRFRSKNAFRIEAELSADKLIVRFRSRWNHAPAKEARPKLFIPFSKLNDCYSCGNFECHKHPDRSVRKSPTAITTYMLDEKWSEYEAYIKTTSQASDHFILPFRQGGWIKINRYLWTMAGRRNVTPVAWVVSMRSLALRILSKAKYNVFSLTLKLDKNVAEKMVRRIPIESTHIVISQNLLPFVWKSGALGGRTFDVLMTRLPMEKLHERLDSAHALHTDSPTLRDFRAPTELVTLESEALTKARHIITPHAEIAAIFSNKSIRLEWTYPKVVRQERANGSKVLFPGSSLGRKGAYEVRKLAQELGLTVIVSGGATEDPSFWEGIKTEKAEADPLRNAGLVIYPAYVEHQPRFLLKAIASGYPVVATQACGLTEGENVTIVPTGDYEALRRAVVKQLMVMETKADENAMVV